MAFWSDFEPATCMPDACFCEAVRDGLIRQPSNTWSNLGFCLAGVWMAVEWGRQRDVGGLRSVEAALFALAVFLVGVTSGLYHASLTFFGQTLDVQAMYLVVLLAFAVNVDALTGARCDQEQRCNNVGSGKRHESRESCRTSVRTGFSDDIVPTECPSGVDRRALSVCLKEVRDEGCGDPLDTLARLASCRTAALCPRS